jgi:hypothetical protein
VVASPRRPPDRALRAGRARNASAAAAAIAAEVYAALWLGALLAAAGELPDPFPPPIEELARRYFEAYPPEVKA